MTNHLKSPLRQDGEVHASNQQLEPIETGGFICECCQRNMELRINGQFCNECAASRSRVSDGGVVATTYDNKRYEKLVEQMSVNSEEVKAIAARAFHTPQFNADTYMFDVRQLLRFHQACCAELHDAICLVRALDQRLHFEEMASKGAIDYTIELEQKLEALAATASPAAPKEEAGPRSNRDPHPYQAHPLYPNYCAFAIGDEDYCKREPDNVIHQVAATTPSPDAAREAMQKAAEEIAKRWVLGDMPEASKFHAFRQTQLQTLAEEVLSKHFPSAETKSNL